MNRLISRQAVLDLLEDTNNGWIINEVLQLPSVKPQEQTGYWLLDDSDDSMICDKCECTVYALDMVDGEIHYCPNCGDKKEGITWID